GKSTLANLIPRFYDVTEGAITIDGQDVRDVTLESLRRYVGLVQQEAFLFDASIGHNVAYADPWAEDETIEGAARTAQIHDHIAGLPDGYETRVGERGVALSGGQRQRLAIARALYRDAAIWIFDEATSALDSESEAVVQRSIEDLRGSKTLILIAHRLSTIRNADRIYVMADGRVAEQGDHAALMDQGGIYAGMVRIQSAN
ncbi:ABC transporter ATP-binding protein, partial [Marinobacter sp.]|uniref:ABC transporter ATP-binding protein n=1 Tax=Marinobacter sp. TaxID=50741 RepID=UPI0035C7000F